jgi:hypothetical protein
MKTVLLLSAIAGSAWAFPVMDNPVAAQVARQLLERRQAGPLSNDPLDISAAETNCGQVFSSRCPLSLLTEYSPTPCLTFDPEDQLVSITGEHAYQSPAAADIRGPCPGLNAAANHGYLPRNGYFLPSMSSRQQALTSI